MAASISSPGSYDDFSATYRYTMGQEMLLSTYFASLTVNRLRLAFEKGLTLDELHSGIGSKILDQPAT